jgi:hypothetical protein
MTKRKFNLIINYLWNIRHDLVNFDFPDYANLSKNFIDELPFEFVDAVQYCLPINDLDLNIWSNFVENKFKELGGLIYRSRS